MHHIRWAIFHSLLIFLVLAGVKCADPSGSGLNAASCSPINGLNQEFEIDTGGYEGPVSLPVTIVKMDGIDAPTMTFVAIDRSLSRAAATIGAIFFYTTDRGPSCSSVGVFINNEQVATLSAFTTDCFYRYDVIEAYLDTPIAFAVISPGGGSISDPVIALVSDVSDLIAIVGADVFEQDYIFQVFITNMARDTPDSTADVLSIPIASMPIPAALASVMSRERADEEETGFVFAAEGSDGQIYPWIVSIDGQADQLSEVPLPATPMKLTNSYEGDTYFITEESLYQLSSAGDSTLIDLPDFVSYPSEASTYKSLFEFDPSEDSYVVYAGLSDSNTARPMFTNLDTGETCILYDQDAHNDFVIGELEVGIVRQNRLVLVGRLADEDNYKVIAFDLSETITNTGTSEAVDYTLCYADYEAVLESENALAYLLANQIQVEDIYLTARIDDVWQLISIPKDGDGTMYEQITNSSVDVLNPTMVGDGDSGIVFELDIGESSRLGCFYAIDLDQTTCFSMGSRFSPLRSDFNYVPYVGKINGYNQLAIKDLSSFINDPSALTITPTSATVPTDHTQDFSVTGGTPPYSFSVVNVTGLATIIEATGQLTPTDDGTVNVVATDAAGDTVISVITVPASGSSNDEYGITGFADLPNLAISGNAMLAQTDSRPVIAGSVGTSAFIGRVESDGSMDTDWNDVGYTITAIGALARYNAVTIDDDDNIVVAGSTDNDFVIARYTSSGVLDTSFSGDGLVTIDFCGDADQAYSVDIDSNDKIVVAGSTTCAGDTNLALVRLTPAGELDTEFNDDGLAEFNVSEGFADEAYAIEMGTDDKIYGVGKMNPDNVSSNTLVFSVNEDGSLNTSFNSDGVALLSFSSGIDLARNFVFDSTHITILGSAVNTASGKSELMVAQLQLTTGNLYSEFGDGGITLLAGPDGAALDGYSIKLMSTGDYMIGARAGDVDATQWALTRITSEGSLDDTFGTNGFVTYTDGLPPNSLNAIEVTGDLDKIFVLGGLNGDTSAGLGAFWP